jgi:hypothetical protein
MNYDAVGKIIFFSFLHALTLLFIALKLTGHIDWSWFAVVSPIAIPMTIGFIVSFIAGFKRGYNGTKN